MLSIQNSSSQPDIISPKTLRKIIGILGMTLPLALIVGAAVFENCQWVQNSISAYYHTVMRNFFVGTLSAISVCFFAYKGYGKTDMLAANLAAVFALGVAFFPTSVSAPFTDCLPEAINNGIIGKIHFICAGLLFCLLAFFCISLFTKHGPNPTKMKLKRNAVYKLCGYIILFCIAAIALYFWWLKQAFPGLESHRPVFYLEALALASFSVSWLTKAEVLLPD